MLSTLDNYTRLRKPGLTLLLAFALLTITTAIYWPGLSGGFIFDDYPNIVTNSAVQVDSLTWRDLRTAAGAYQPGTYGRPLATITFAVNHVLGGKAPWGYKLGNLLVHLLNALLVFWLLRRLLSLPRSGNAWPPSAPFVIALLWAIHPLQVSSVLYVVQRMETLSLTFVLLALIAYVRGRLRQLEGKKGWSWLVASIPLAAIGMLSKETAILFPAYTLALELTLLGFDARSIQIRRWLKAAYWVGALLAVFVFLMWVLPRYAAPHAFDGRDFTLHERLLTQLRVLPMYLGQMVLPVPSALSFYYDTYPKSTGWLSPATTVVGGIFLLLLFGAAWLERRRMPIASLGVFWFFAAHLLTSNVFNLELVFEHRNYFALLGVLLAVSDLARRLPASTGPSLKRLAVVAILIGFAFLGAIRSAMWGDPLRLALDLVDKNTASPRASSDLAAIYIGLSRSDPNSPFFALGAAEFKRGSSLPNSSPLPEQGLILMAATTDQPVDPQWWDRLIAKVRTRPISPQELMAVTGLMKQRYRGIDLDDTRLTEAFSTLLTRYPQPELHVQFGDYALRYLDNQELADAQFAAAVDLASKTAPDYPAKIAGALVSDGRTRQAKVVLERMVALGLTDRKPDIAD